MGAHNSHSALKGVVHRTEKRAGKITVTGRYHNTAGGRKLEDDYEMADAVLGSGYNGQVHLAMDRKTRNKVAVKDFKLHGVPSEKKQELESECEIFLGMDHPHVARLVDVYESSEKLSLVMECMTGGELFKRVIEKKKFPEADAADAAWQMLLAINYIHSHDVVHRDIKLENFLYDTPESNHLKLIDFGFSKIWHPNTKMALSCGTLAYVAPEVLERSYTSQCDMWSLGVTIFIVLFGYMPFVGNDDHQIESIKAGRYVKKPEVWKKVSQNATDFVTKLLVVDPQKRMTAESALAHAWIAKRNELAGEGAFDPEIAEALVAFSQASHFRRAAMSVMAWSLTNEERATVRDAFIAMDKDRQGTITLGEFKTFMMDKFHVDDEHACAAFEALDVNHTEEIHYSEFLAAMVSSRVALHDHLLQDTFRRFDVDNTGYISTENMRSILGESFEGEEIEQMISEVHHEKENKISYKEFIAYLKSGDSHTDHHEKAAKVIDKIVREDTSKTKQSKGTLRQRTQARFSGGKDGKKEGAQDGSKKGCGCSLQ